MPSCGKLALALAGIAIGTWSGVASARERAVRRFDAISEASLDRARALAEDAAGFVWVGDGLGLLRFDGREFTRMHELAVDRAVFELVRFEAGVAALDVAGALHRVDEVGAESLAGPWLGAVDHISVDLEGRLHALAQGRLWRRAAGWQEVPLKGAPAPTLVAFAPDGALWIASGREVWRVAADVAERRFVSQLDPIAQILVRDEDDVWIADVTNVYRLRGGAVEVRLPRAAVDGRRVAMVARGTAVWAAIAHTLVRLDERGFEVVGAAERIDSGGPLLVDREGSLWMGSYRGLYQFPEPDTAAWNTDEGLPSHNTRRLTRAPEGLWVSTWNGAALLRPGAGVVRESFVSAFDRVCVDAEGQASALVGDALLRWRGRWEQVASGAAVPSDCAPAEDGGVWWVYEHSLIALRGDAVHELPGPWLAGEASVFPRVLEDSRGELWITAAAGLCHAPAAALRGGGGEWRCSRPGQSGRLIAIVESDAGTMWAAVLGDGLFEREADGPWRALDRGPRARAVEQMQRSPQGGVWLLGQGVIERVVAEGAGLRTIERPSAWHGLAVSSAVDALDEPNGVLWLATDSGVVEVPATARRAAVPAPPMVLTQARVGGRVHTFDGALQVSADEAVELHFRAPSYREPSRLLYRWRLGPELPWSAPSREATLQLGSLPFGRSEVEVAVSLDGEVWGEEPARCALEVHAPWYRRWYTWVAFFGLAVTVGAALHRLRQAVARQVAAQRLAIARDLHDEMGSGLGSIGLLASMVPTPGPEGHDAPAARISAIAAELGESLDDLVWSLRATDDTIGGLAARLVERAGDLCGARARVRCALPEPLPADRLSLVARRHLLLIGLEALHNVSRHAAAETVEVGLAPAGPRRWRLWIADDGRGLDAPSSATGTGQGLANMRARAAQIGAHLRIAGAGPGTRVEVEVACLRPLRPRSEGGPP